MDGIYDYGGVVGFGEVPMEENEPVFHEDWEALTYCWVFLGNTLPNGFNADEYRHAVERIEPKYYMSFSYYDRVLTAAASLFVEKGFVTREELEEKADGHFPLALPVSKTAGESIPPVSTPFSVGDKVRVRELNATGHTRAPKYVRGKSGVILHVTPPFSLPDAAAHGLDHPHEPTYHVRFEGRELWGDTADPNTSVVVDLWQIYLEAA